MPTSRPTPGANDVWGAQLNAWLDENLALKANDADVMKLTGDQTATGTKTFDQIKLGTVTLTKGTGSPQGVVAAPVGSQYFRTDGGTGTTVYRKESGTGNTGWVAGAGAPSGTAGGALAGSYPNPTLSEAAGAKTDGWFFGDEITVGASTKAPYPAMRAQTLTGLFVARVATAPQGRSIILDIKRHVGGGGVGTSIFATTAARPTIGAGATSGTYGALGITALAAGDTLVPEVIQTGLAAATQVVRLVGSSDSGTTSAQSAPIPIDVATAAGEKLVVALVMGGASLNPTPFPLTLPSGWDQLPLELTGGTFGTNMAVLTKDAVANEPTGQTIGFSGGANRPWAIATIGITNSALGVEALANHAGTYSSSVTSLVAPEPMPATSDFAGVILNMFAMRATDPDTTTTGHQPTVSGTPHSTFTELVDRDTNRVDLTNVGVEVSWRSAVANQAALPAAERTLTLAGSSAGGTFNGIASTVVVKTAVGSPGADLTFDFEYTT